MTLSMEHTEAEGILLQGTSRGDGSAEVVKGLGCPGAGASDPATCPEARDVPPRRPLIDTTVQRLREVGHEVEVSIDTTLQDRGEGAADHATLSRLGGLVGVQGGSVS